MFFLKKKFRDKTGFTLIEALISMTIVLIAIVGPLVLLFNAININRQERDRVVAAYLAEEVVENFRAYRDGFVLACQNINYDAGVCNAAGASIGIDNAILTETSNPRTIAWMLFINSLNRSNFFNAKEIYLDNASFSSINLSSPSNRPSCDPMYYHPSNGFNCLNIGSKTPYARTIKLFRFLDNPSVIKIEVEVIYTRSGFLLSKGKTVKVVDYIYER